MAPPMVTPMVTPMTQMSQRKYGRWSPTEQGITLTWRDLSVYALTTEQHYFRQSKITYKRIINNVCGAVKPGSLVCIMGGSGAGKSTLMAALAFRNATGMLMEGEVRVNGRPVGSYMHRLSGYMHQEDLFVGTLTVQEHLGFNARLRMDRRTTAHDRRRHVAWLLSELGLSNVADTQIGSVGNEKTLSGGEKKRLSFATEMLTDPKLLFCDEPTTGLDSYSAQKLVEMMKKMAAAGKTVLCTIHQPSSEIFDMFHQLVLVADGRVAFIGDKKSALDFFESQGYTCPVGYNPADFFIRILATMPGSEESSRLAVRKICDRYAVSDAASQVDVVVQLEVHMGSSYELSEDIGESHKKFKSVIWYTKLLLLIYRSLLIVLRDPAVQFLRIIQKVAIALTAGLCFLGTIDNTQAGVQSVQGALFIIVTENTFTPMYSVLSMFPLEVPLFMREYRSGLYSARLFYISKMIATLPGLVLEPLIFVLIAYWLAGLRNTAYAFSITALVATLTMNVSSACGFFFSNAFGNVSVAMAYLVPFDYILMISAGVYIKLSTMPAYIAWMKYLSWLMYANEAMTIVQWEGTQNITCDTQHPELPCLVTGQQVLDTYSFSESHLSRNIAMMFLLYFGFHFLAYVFLLRRAKKQ